MPYNKTQGSSVPSITRLRLQQLPLIITLFPYLLGAKMIGSKEDPAYYELLLAQRKEKKKEKSWRV